MPKDILILLSDTGGGHRASAGAVREGLEYVYGEEAFKFTILDIWTEYGSWPFSSFVSVYRFASENPWCWRWMYESSKSPISRSLFLASGYAVSGANFKGVLGELKPDLIISVHPLCQHVPLQIIEELQDETGYRPIFVTVVTDLGGAHPTWFHPRCTRVYVPSLNILQAARAEGVTEARLKHFGLPLRQQFWRRPTLNDFAASTPTNKEKTATAHTSANTTTHTSTNTSTNAYSHTNANTSTNANTNANTNTNTFANTMANANTTTSSSTNTRGSRGTTGDPGEILRDYERDQRDRNGERERFHAPIERKAFGSREELKSSSMVPEPRRLIHIDFAKHKSEAAIVTLKSDSDGPLGGGGGGIGGGVGGFVDLPTYPKSCTGCERIQSAVTTLGTTRDNHAAEREAVQFEMRKRLELNELFPTVLLVGGGEGVGALDTTLKAIIEWALKTTEEVLQSQHVEEGTLIGQLQILVVCGKNEHTRTKCVQVVENCAATAAAATASASRVTLDDRSVTYTGPGAVNASPLRSPSPSRSPPPHPLRLPKPPPAMAVKPTNVSDSTAGSPRHHAAATIRSATPLTPDLAGGVDLRAELRTAAATAGACEMSNVPNIPMKQETGNETNEAMTNPHNSNNPKQTRSEEENFKRIKSGVEAAINDARDPRSPGTPLGQDSGGSSNDPEGGVQVHVVIYSFVSKIGELMTASNLVVTKAGPGTIAEACTRGLPILLSSYMPGQEEGNVSFVLNNKFGSFCDDFDQLGLIVREWLLNPRFEIKLDNMRERSLRAANPLASVEIARDIGRMLGLKERDLAI